MKITLVSIIAICKWGGRMKAPLGCFHSVLTVGLLLISNVASASVTTFYLDYARFNDAGTATGYFSVDPSVGVTAIDITTSAGNNLPGENYTTNDVTLAFFDVGNVGGGLPPDSAGLEFRVGPFGQPNSAFLTIYWADYSTTQARSFDITGGLAFEAGDCANYSCNSRYFISGEMVPEGASSAVPEPSTWAFMFVGFAGLGFAGYRRTKRKDDVAFSAA